MSTKKHVTALGVPFDMAALRSKNEKTRAVGNMNVNARGDILDSNNNVINDNTKRVNTMYERSMQRNTPNKNARHAPIKGNVPTTEATTSELNDLDDHIPNPKK